MADNVTLNSGTGGAVAATDDVAGVHYQYVKLADGTADSSAKIAGDATNGLDVDVTRVIPGTSATHLGKAVDAAAGATDTGIAALVVRDDSLSALTPVDGDYTHLRTTSTGALWVQNAGASSILTDDAAFTPGTSSVAVVGGEADESSTDSVDEGDAGALRITLDRKLIVNTQPHTAGGLSIFRSIDLDETEEDVKTAAGCVYGVWLTNTATATRWVKFYNATAANVTVGTTTPVLTFGIPGNTSDDVSGLFSSANGIMFDTAISAAATTGVADNDTGAPGANEVIINVFYK